MTPLELLEEVKGRFIVLYHNDEAALKRLLKQALGKYQDKAGVILQTYYPAGTTEADLPDLYLTVASCHDEKGQFIPVYVDDVNRKLFFDITDSSLKIRLYWLARLRDWPEEKDLPYGCVGLVSDYLEALIDIPNTHRTRDAWHDINGPIQDLPSVQDLKNRLAELELQMEECRAIVPALSISY